MCGELDKFVDRQRIDHITWDLIPAPPRAEHPGDHLFVNVSYTDKIGKRPAHEILSDATADACEILQVLLPTQLMLLTTSVCISFFARVHGVVTRVLRVSVMREDLMESKDVRAALRKSRTLITSEFPEIEDLLRG